MNALKEIWYSKVIAGNQKNVNATITAYTYHSNYSFSRTGVGGNGAIIFTPIIHLNLEFGIQGEKPLRNQIEYSFCIPGYAIGHFNKVCHSIRTVVSSSAKEAIEDNEVLKDLRFCEDNLDKIHKQFYFIFKKFEDLVLSYPLIHFDMVKSLKDYETYKSTLEGYTNQYLDTYYKNNKSDYDELDKNLITISDFVGKDHINITVLNYDHCLHRCDIPQVQELLLHTTNNAPHVFFENINKIQDDMLYIRNLGIRNIKTADILFIICPSEEISDNVETYIREILDPNSKVLFANWIKNKFYENSQEDIEKNVKIVFDNIISFIKNREEKLSANIED